MKKTLIYAFFLTGTFFPIILMGQGTVDTVQHPYRTTDNIPEYRAFLGTKKEMVSSIMPKPNLLVQRGVNCECTNYNFDAPCQITSYKLKLISNKGIIYESTSNNRFFTKQMKQHFDKLQKGDLILIYDIYGNYPNGTTKIPPIVYEIK